MSIKNIFTFGIYTPDDGASFQAAFPLNDGLKSKFINNGNIEGISCDVRVRKCTYAISDKLKDFFNNNCIRQTQEKIESPCENDEFNALLKRSIFEPSNIEVLDGLIDMLSNSYDKLLSTMDLYYANLISKYIQSNLQKDESFLNSVDELVDKLKAKTEENSNKYYTFCEFYHELIYGIDTAPVLNEVLNRKL